MRYWPVIVPWHWDYTDYRPPYGHGWYWCSRDDGSPEELMVRLGSINIRFG
jgi:hypothetical protein